MAEETGGLAPLLAGAGQTGTRAGLVHLTTGAQALALHTMSPGTRGRTQRTRKVGQSQNSRCPGEGGKKPQHCSPGAQDWLGHDARLILTTTLILQRRISSFKRPKARMWQSQDLSPDHAD